MEKFEYFGENRNLLPRQSLSNTAAKNETWPSLEKIGSGDDGTYWLLRVIVKDTRSISYSQYCLYSATAGKFWCTTSQWLTDLRWGSRWWWRWGKCMCGRRCSRKVLIRCPYPVGDTYIRQKTSTCTPNPGSTWTGPQSGFKGHTKIFHRWTVWG